MNRDELVPLANRDRRAIADAKASYWADLKRDGRGEQGLIVGDALRRQILAQHPGWPAEAERALDLETHVRAAGALHPWELPSDQLRSFPRKGPAE